MKCKENYKSRKVAIPRLDLELDTSRQMLQQKTRELLGSDLAELRIQKTERKVPRFRVTFCHFLRLYISEHSF